MKSMTGCGSGQHVAGGYRAAVELSSVNRKGGDLTVSLPRDLEVLEARLREQVLKRISRGRLHVRLTVEPVAGAGARGRVNEELAQAYVKALRGLGKKLGLDGDVTLEVLARIPGVVDAQASALDPEAIWPSVAGALEKALAGLNRMREREGKHLAAELRRLVRELRRIADRVAGCAPGVQARYLAQLRERVRAAGFDLAAGGEERLLKELVLFADRSDVTEELTRLRSHFAQFDGLLKSAEPVGRTLDFLSQEINREINTIGSKANDGEISADVVRMKTELEKFREQVQNVE